jgi:hypothetical protein
MSWRAAGRAEQLVRMDQRFVERMQHAIARGLERKPYGEGPARAA